MADSLIARGRATEQGKGTAGYDPGRLRRASVRAVRKLGPHQYRVAGTHQRYYDVSLESDTPCYCKDAEFHGRGCLHELAARLHHGDVALIQALGDMLFKAEQANRDLTRQRRKQAR